MSVMPIVKGWEKGQEKLEIRERIMAIQPVLMWSARILRRILDICKDLLSLWLLWNTTHKRWCEKSLKKKIYTRMDEEIKDPHNSKDPERNNSQKYRSITCPYVGRNLDWRLGRRFITHLKDADCFLSGNRGTGELLSIEQQTTVKNSKQKM